MLTRVLCSPPLERQISPKEKSNPSTHPAYPSHFAITRFKSSKSKFDTEADLESFAGCFDKGLKTAFSEDSKPKFVKFGPARDVHESSRNKAVAFGAISYCLDRFVAGRLIKYTYGTIAHIDFDVCDPEHLGRSGKKRFNVTGGFALEVFVPVLTKVGSIRSAPGSN